MPDFAIKREIAHVPMRDGAVLSVHIHRPDTAEKVPAILQYTPYRKPPLGPHEPIVEHGYAYVYFDIRGTGNSGGAHDSLYSDAERQDGYDMVEWTAAQPWCSGAVGMTGISFGAVVSIQIAAAAPPHLKAIMVYSGSDDPYTEWTNPGGCFRPYMHSCYAPLMAALNFAPPDPGELGERWANVWNQRLEGNVPWGIPWIQNLLDGPHWRDRSMRGKYDRVKCAVFTVCGWADWYHSPMLRIFEKVNTPKRTFIGPWSHSWPEWGIPGPRMNWLREAVKWWDRHLKGIDNGLDAEPPVTIFVRDSSEPATFLLQDKGVFRQEREWPIGRRVETPFYLGESGALQRERNTSAGTDTHRHNALMGMTTGWHGGGAFNYNWAMPLDQRPDEALSMTYTTEPLDEDIEITGQPRARLFVSCDAPSAQLVVKLSDVTPEGPSVLITKGWLQLTHRESHTKPTPLEPGKVYEVDVELHTCAHRLKKGHRLRVSVAAADLYNVWPTPHACTVTLHRGPSHPSRVVLPLIPPQSPTLPPPVIEPSPHAMPTRAQLSAPTLNVTYDIINQTATVEHFIAYAPTMQNRATYRVSAANPAEAVIRAQGKFQQEYAGRHIVVDSDVITSSDAKAFHQTTSVRISIDGKPYWSKDWAVSVPRGTF